MTDRHTRSHELVEDSPMIGRFVFLLIGQQSGISMSNLQVNAMRSIRLPPIYKMVFWVLCDVSDEYGDSRSYAPLSRLINETCLSRDSVIRALSWLESVNLISANRDNGRQTVYQITIEKANHQAINDEVSRKKIAGTREIKSPKPVDHSNQSTTATSRPQRIEPVDHSVQPVDHSVQPVDAADTNHHIPLIPQEHPTKARDKNPKDEPWCLSKISLPDFIDQDAWDGYIEMRIKIKKPMLTKRTFVLVINELERIYKNGLDPNKSLDNSTRSNWTDVYAPRAEIKQIQQKPKGAWDIDSCQPKENIRTIRDEGVAQCLPLKN